MHNLEIKLSCKKSIEKACIKNPTLRKALERKIKEILENPAHYKPLRNELAGERRVHILKSFVLRFEIAGDTVILLSFDHHDNAYQH